MPEGQREWETEESRKKWLQRTYRLNHPMHYHGWIARLMLRSSAASSEPIAVSPVLVFLDASDETEHKGS